VQSSGTTTRKTRNTRDFEMNEGAFAEEEEENKKNGTSPAQQQQQQQQIARRFLISSYDVTGVSNDLIALAKSVMTIKPNYSYTANEVQEQVTLINQLGVFKKIEPQVTETRDGMVIDFQLESHPEIRSIVVSGCDYLPNTVLTNAFKGQMNKVLNMHKFHSGMRKIRDWYNVNAIPSNILGADVDTDTGVVELRISEPKIGNVNVRFLDAAGNPQKKGTTKPSIIARYLSNVKPGKVYSIKGVQDDLRAVYANCPVEDVSSQPIPRNAAAGVQQQQQQQAEGENLVSRDTTAKVQDSMIMDFTVNIVEKSPGGFSAGGGMSAKGLTEGNFGGLLANVNYVQRNLFGKCQKLNLGLEVVPKSNSKKGIDADIKLSLSDPWIEGDKRRTARTFNLNTAAISASQIYGASQFQDDNDEGAEDRLSSAFNVDANSTRMNVNNNIGDIGSSTINDNKVGDNNNSVGEKTGGFSKTISQLSGGKSRDDTVAKEDSTRNDENNAAPSNNKKDSSNEVRVRKLISSIDYSRPLANGWNGTFIASWCRSSLWDGQRNSILHDAYGAPLTFSGSGCDVAATSQLRVVYSAPDGDTQLMLSAEQALPLRPDWLNFTRLFARAQRTFQFPIFSSSKGREQNLGSMMSTDRETDEIKRGAFASTPIKLTLASKGGNVIGDLPPHEAFPIGGTNSVRGYNEGAVGTARKFVVGSAELVVPTGIEHISASLFFDCGSDLNSGSSILGDPAGTRGKPGSGFGYGAGFQLASPFGPLRLEYAKNDHGITRAHFGIGRSF
jgi:outer membrane protein assembly factor BamA